MTSVSEPTEILYWETVRSPAFSDLANGGRAVLLPLVSLRTRSDGQPLNLEEQVLARILPEAVTAAGAESFVVMPTFRFTARQAVNQIFGLPLNHAVRGLKQWVRSASASGFQTFVFIHSHPDMIDWLDCAGRELRIEGDIFPYRIGLHGAGLDLSDPDPNLSSEHIGPVADRLASLLRAVVQHAAEREGGKRDS